MKEAREVSFIDVDKVEFYDGKRPSEVVLRAERFTFDIGSYCFAERDDRAGSRSQIKRVERNSYCEVRAKCIPFFINYFIQLRNYRGLSLSTIRGAWAQLKIFLDWCDRDPRFLDLTVVQERRDCVKEFCLFMGLQYRLDDIAKNKYATAQRSIIEIVSVAFDDEYVGHGVPRLKHNNLFGTPTEVPEDDVQARSYAMCRAAYVGFSNLFVGFERYPYSWKLPDYLGGALWVFPCMIKFRSPFSNASDGMTRPALTVDFEKGSVRSLDDAEIVYNNRETARTCRNLMLKQIREANSDPRSIYRITLANHAMIAFAAMFQAKTSMNFKQVCELPWGDSYKIEKSDPHFKVIKWRAGGVLKTFRASTEFVAEFELFLEFRSRLLNGVECSLLFFTVPYDKKVCALDSCVLVRLEKFLLRVDKDFRLVRTREWRAAKSDSHIAKFNTGIASITLQSEPETIEVHYSQGRESDQKKQFSEFFRRLVVVVGKLSERFTQIGVAMCQSVGNPEAEENAPIAPDCKGDFGCFFCKFFKVHANEEGVRKLLSCRYFVERVSYINPSEIAQSSWYQPVIDRIDEIIDYIESLSPDLSLMVADIERSINEEHQLDSYWEGKIELLIQVGVL
ncbi:hypothetical protein NAV31_16600 [Pseudomonas stutzeri]|nr:hypothetical protein [Stutzerimonas degradans]